jgi:hypothetical protein
VALFVVGVVQMTGGAFVEFTGLAKAGHATQPRCYTSSCCDVASGLECGGRQAYGDTKRRA